MVNNFGAKTAKIHIVGQLSTVQKLVEFSEKFLEVSMQLSRDRVQMMALKRVLDDVNRRLTEIDAQILQQAVIHGGQSPSVTTLAQQREALWNLSSHKSSELGKLSLDLSQRAVTLAAGLEPMETEAVIAARQDLGFPATGPAFDSGSYRQLMGAATKKVTQAFDNYIAALSENKPK